MEGSLEGAPIQAGDHDCCCHVMSCDITVPGHVI